MQCDNAKLIEVRNGENGPIVGNDIICTIRDNKVIGGCRSIMSGFDMPECYRVGCQDRVMNGVFINRE